MNGNVAWNAQEVEAAVSDYMHMLTMELAGQSYNKTAHRRALQLKLHDRSERSIELKHQNISAILIQLGCPYITGYKPLYNYQAMLLDAVERRLVIDSNLDRSALSAAEQPAVMPLEPEIDLVVEPPPVLAHALEQKGSQSRRIFGARPPSWKQSQKRGCCCITLCGIARPNFGANRFCAKTRTSHTIFKRTLPKCN